MVDQWKSQKFLIFYLFFHHKLMILFGLRECFVPFISVSVIEIIFMFGSFQAINLLELGWRLFLYL